MGDDSEIALRQLKRTLRAELMREFALPLDPLPTIILPLSSRVSPQRVDRGWRLDDEDRRAFLSFTAIVLSRPYRLVIHPEDAPGWEVTSLHIGVRPAFATLEPIDAVAFAPLPAWLTTELAPELHAIDELRLAIAACPLENIERSCLQIGSPATLQLQRTTPESKGRVPRAWLLAHVLREDVR